MLMLNLGCGNRVHAAWINIDYSSTAWIKEWGLVRFFVSNSLPPNYMNHDLRRGIPFASETVDVVYNSHILEHLKHNDSLPFLLEIYRVLKPGGVVRVVVPDLEKAAINYLEALSAVRTGKTNATDYHAWATISLLDQMVRTELGGEMAPWLRNHRHSPVVQEMQGIYAEISQSTVKAHTNLVTKLTSLIRRSNPSSTGELHRWMYDEISLANLLKEANFQNIQRTSHLDSRIPNWINYELDNNRDGSPHQPGSIWMEASK